MTEQAPCQPWTRHGVNNFNANRHKYTASKQYIRQDVRLWSLLAYKYNPESLSTNPTFYSFT